MFTDTLGSVVAASNNLSGSGAVLGNQAYGPYGNTRYSKGSVGTQKGFTGQIADPISGLDDYGARYYDPVVGRFTTADRVQGNAQGMDPYAYVGNNPETRNDPTGNMFVSATGPSGGSGIIDPNGTVMTVVPNVYNGTPMETITTSAQIQQGGYDPNNDPNNSTAAKIANITGWTSLQQTFTNPKATTMDKVGAIGGFIATNLNNLFQLGLIFGGPEDSVIASAADPLISDVGATVGDTIAGDVSASVSDTIARDTTDSTVASGACSFTSSTVVTTPQGKQAIGTLHAGEKVLAYNSKTKQMEQQPIVHVWVHPDNDLVDLTLTTTTHAPHSSKTSTTSEVIHTNKKHPFLTEEQGFVPVGQLHVGMHVREADGQYGVITGWKLKPGTQTMYNLEVAQDHTFMVGDEQWIVHNCSSPISKTLFHYTDQKGLNGILKDQAINPSLNPRFAHFGPGQYLTDIAPEQIEGGLASLSVKLFAKASVAWKLTNYIEINVEGLEVIEGRPNVFLVPGENPLDIAQRVIRFGSTLP